MGFFQNQTIDAAQIAEEFMAFLREEWPAYEVKGWEDERVVLVMPGGAEAKLSLQKLHDSLASLRRPVPKRRRQAYAAFARLMLEPNRQILDLDSMDEADLRARVYPRVAPPAMLTAIARQTGGKTPPSRPLADSDYSIVYVLDFDDRVAYVLDAQAQTLNLDEAGLYEQALANARRLVPRESVRRALSPLGLAARKVANFIDCPDNHAAARLLLMPGFLEPGEEFAAAIVENHLFFVGIVPPSNNWNTLRGMTRVAKSGVHQPFLVTPGGIKAM